MNLKGKLAEWAAAGLLSSAQAEAILDHENKKPQRSWVVFGVVGIGVIVMMTGIISIIAANWDVIGPYQKLAAYFVLQLCIGAAFFRRRDLPGAVREGLLLVFCLLFLGGIGLVGQIYNLQSDGWQGLLMWLVLISPVVFFADNRLIFHLWFSALAAAAVIWVQNGHLGTDDDRRLCAYGLVFLVFAFSQLRLPKIPQYWMGAAFAWSCFVLLCFLAVYANVTWCRTAWGGTFPLTPRSLFIIVPLAALALAIAAVALNGSLTKQGRGALVAMLFLFGWYLLLPEWIPIRGSDLAGAVMFIAVWSCAAAAAAYEQRKRLFDLCTSIIAIRFIVIYFEVFGSLTATGFGLFISGAVILGVTYGWNRFRRAMHQRLEARA